MRSRSTFFALACLCALASCGGSSSPPSAPPASEQHAAPATPAAACLALASAPRSRRPDEPARIGVRHVLVKHAGATRADDTLQRTREEACLRALEARDALRDGADFSAIVEKYSDEPGAASRGGSVGTVERAEVAPAFADAAFELDLHQLSDIVETEFGFHVIQRVD